MIRSRKQLDALTPRSRRSYDNARKVLGYARARDVSIASAVRELRGRGVASSTESVRKYFGDAVERKSGRYVAQSGDRSLRVMHALTPQGPREIETAGSRKASAIGSHQAALKSYLRTGDDAALQAWSKRYGHLTFKGSDGQTYALETDPDAIEERDQRGEIATEDIYSELS